MSFYLMCDDLERAALNRKIISQKLYITAYLQVEAWLENNIASDLPYWMYSEGFVGDRAKDKKKAGKKGGDARMYTMTPAQRSKIAQKASHSRKSYLSKQPVIIG